MYIKQIISVHPRSSCTIFCAKCGTALLKIRPFEGFAPQLYPENPKMRYSSTQAPASPSSLAPASPSSLASRISLHHISRISLLPGFRGFSLRHITYGSLRRCTEPAIARKGRGTGGKTEEPAEKRKTSGRTEKRRKNGKPAKNGKTEKRKTGGTGEEQRNGAEPEGKRRNRRRTEKRRKRRRNGGGGRKLSTGGDVRIALNFSDF